MIFTAVFALVLAIFGSILSVLIPALPASVESIFTSITVYIQAGLKFVWLFVPKDLCIGLFQWWITLAAILFTYELGLFVWRLITGNAGGQEATSETMTIDTGTGEVLSHTSTTTWRERSKWKARK